ncbi:MAG: hypothetical protein KDB03_02945 [Planctomycetales bacterium]|nr:hypothetical protein [Planctomycetales bacterium]
MKLLVFEDGTVRSIYDDLFDWQSLGQVSIQRASHVEPTSEGTWTADLSPVGGQILGPFTKRSSALSAERQWLNDWLQFIHGEHSIERTIKTQ